jgi:alcohol dehydrogenase class IV
MPMRPGSYSFVPLEKIIWGVPAVEALPSEIEQRSAARVFIVASGTLSRKTEVIDRVAHALGERYVGRLDECREHAPLESVIDCLSAARRASPDLIVTIGGGSIIDTAKIVQLGLTHDVHTIDDLLGHANKPTPGPSRIRQLIVPTTLSGSEFTNSAGSLDVRKKLKVGFSAGDMCGQTIVLDPELSLHTPEKLWYSTAIRSIDHAIESFCASASNAYIRANTSQAVRLFFSSLRRTRQDPRDLDARLTSQEAVWLATPGLFRVPMGASHGISYLLGSIGGAPHGYTSCVTLPAVLRWNETVNGDLQRELAAAIGEPGRSVADSLGALLDDLNLPRTLKDIGIVPAMIPQIVEYALQSPVVAGNPRPIKTEADVLEILKLAS